MHKQTHHQPLVRVFRRERQHPMGNTFTETLWCGHYHIAHGEKDRAERRRCWECGQAAEKASEAPAE